jgi:hypothetical protein
MKESKHQHRSRLVEEASITSPAVPEQEKEHWPVGPLPDAPVDPDSKPAFQKGDEAEKGSSKTPDNGFDEWSVSWP